MEKGNKRALDVQMSGVKVGGNPCETGGEEGEGKKGKTGWRRKTVIENHTSQPHTDRL